MSVFEQHLILIVVIVILVLSGFGVLFRFRWMRVCFPMFYVFYPFLYDISFIPLLLIYVILAYLPTVYLLTSMLMCTVYVVMRYSESWASQLFK